MKVLAVIPARDGSTRIPDKNMQQLDGRTLVQVAADSAREDGIEDVIVSTNNPTIACGERYVRRPESISGPSADISEALCHALTTQEEETGQRYDWVINLHPTLPCRPRGMIAHMVRLCEEEGLKAAISVRRTVPWMWRIFEEGVAGNEWYPNAYPRSQDFERDGAWLAEFNCITVTARETILEGKRWELPIALVELPEWAIVDIDTPEDLELARRWWPSIRREMESNGSVPEYHIIRTIHQIGKRS